MKNDSRFNQVVVPVSTQETVEIDFEGQVITAQKGDNLAAVLLGEGVRDFRLTAKNRVQKAPFCMMGACYECLVEIDGQSVQACMIEIDSPVTVKRKV